MTSHLTSALSSKFRSWLNVGNALPLDDLNSELSDEDLEQVAGGLTRTWEAPIVPVRNAMSPTTIQTDDRGAL